MKNLMKLAMGAAIAGALVNVFMKQRASRSWPRTPRRLFDAPLKYDRDYYQHNVPPTELVADHQSVGEGSGDDRVELPDDGRVGQGALNS